MIIRAYSRRRTMIVYGASTPEKSVNMFTVASLHWSNRILRIVCRQLYWNLNLARPYLMHAYVRLYGRIVSRKIYAYLYRDSCTKDELIHITHNSLADIAPRILPLSSPPRTSTVNCGHIAKSRSCKSFDAAKSLAIQNIFPCHYSSDPRSRRGR
jgi:hypothetical protein